ncbi:hypothetical protein CPB84DRAFT_1764424 [Gymnopilus junonius]|uniref:Uncharacterized protein n=1 Tax=Gymnopilus junonius TaxID=109634 RepID=A0A9P5NZB4_GYMJU|nr:hypothetical protein CPB84DRAFT_1764424 [Gymnopilus junonius]
MLARFSMRAVRGLVDAQIQQTVCSTDHEDEESSLVVDLYALRSLLFPIPENPWHRIATVCGQALPLCASIQKTLSGDFNNVALLLLDLELRHMGPEILNDVLPVGLLNEEYSTTLSQSGGPGPMHFPSRSRPPKKRRKASHPILSPLVIPSPHPSVPSIIITLSPPQSRETSCLVPYQDYAFGHRLAVPCHPVFNKIHPPMIRDSHTPLHRNGCKWQHGHWIAILPSLAEQAKKGVFSRAMPSRRRIHGAHRMHKNR